MMEFRVVASDSGLSHVVEFRGEIASGQQKLSKSTQIPTGWSPISSWSSLAAAGQAMAVFRRSASA